MAASAATPLAARKLTLAHAVGLALAEPLRALSPLPPFDTSAMDGYAVAGDGPWQVVGRVLAGTSDCGELASGTAVEIATGAQVPRGATAVLPYERAEPAGRAALRGCVGGPAERGRHIRPAGEECAAGDELLPAGTLFTAAAVGLAAATGHDSVRVHPRPRVALLVNGDELLDTGLPRGGRIRDALGPQLPALVRGCGGAPLDVRRIPDRVDALAAALDCPADVVVTTGSSSVGPADHLARVLRRVGAEFLVCGVACKPGHPQLLAKLPDARFVVGLPGNPLAALTGVVTLLAPLLRALAGRPPATAEFVRLDVAARDDVTLLLPVRVTGAGTATVVPHHGSAMLRGIAAADGFAVVSPAAGRTEQPLLLRLPG